MRRFLNKVLMLLGIVSCSQLPVFIDQYAIRLEGHAAESTRHMEAYKKAAADGHKTLTEYVEKFCGADDLDFCREGILIQELVARDKFLQEALISLRDSGIVMRPISFLMHVDREIVDESWHQYRFGFSCTKEVVVWTGIGGILGFVLCVFASFCSKKMRVF